MTASVLGSRRFTLEDQLEFAEMSGDRNPIHLDAIAARRTIYGNIVVHGVHSLLWALECLAQVVGQKRALAHLKTEFKHEMHLEDVICCKLLHLDDRIFKLCLEGNEKILVRIEGALSQSPFELQDLSRKANGPDCRELSFEESSKASGSVELFLDADRFRRRFPGVYRLLPSGQIAELLATTRLVGMECPGLHSIYSALDLHFGQESTRSDTLDYQVARADSRFAMLWLNAKAPGMSGTITAFVRPRPQTQAGIEAVRRLVNQNEFCNIRALVVGGSRGLGEITAKIVAAGGGDVWITYYRGKEDGERVTREIRSARFKCNHLRFDATAPAELSGEFSLGWKPNTLFYFATPPISLGAGDWFSSEKFHTYCRFYLTGFSSTVERVLHLVPQTLSIFYPSTVFLDDFQECSTEYCAAKAAGELLCRHLERAFPHVSVYAPRLGRMKTDQTSALMPTDAKDPMFDMLNAVRVMAGSKMREVPPS
jgi:hypothetical protein